MIVVNKSDLARSWTARELGAEPAIEVSALTGDGLDAVRAALVHALPEPSRCATGHW